MGTGVWRERALGDLTNDELESMLRENETLFVEWKERLPKSDDGYNFSKAVASFANTLGGWVLVGVADNGEITSGQPSGWDPTSGNALVDRVGAILANHVDPVPPFAAALREVGPEGRKVGVIRVYESADTPHVLKADGAVTVRGVANTTKRKGGQTSYESQGATHPTIRELVARGSIARERAIDLLRPRACLPVERALSIAYEPTAIDPLTGQCNYQRVDAPLTGVSALLRVVPHAKSRMEDWAVSEAALEVLAEAHRGLGNLRAPEFRPESDQHGLVIRGTSDRQQRVYKGQPVCDVTAVVDGRGVLGFGLAWRDTSLGPEERPSILHLQGVRDQIIKPLFDAAWSALEGAEFLGRAWFQLDLLRLSNLVRLSDADCWPTRGVPFHVEFAGELTVPAESGSAHISDRCRDDLARIGGAQTFRT